MSNAYSPCPFCGGDDLHVSGGRFLDQVYCTQCDAYGPARTPGHSVAAWNRRAQPAAPAEQEISADEKFCDGHCSWAEHHPDCSLSAPPAQPVAHLWQHGETGRTRIVMPDQIFTADANWLLVGPMYLHPAAAPADAAPSVAPEPVAWEGGEGWESLAWELCADENGEDACNELIWEGGPIPEPWGDRWMKYEGEAKRLIALVHKHAAHPPRAPLTDEQALDVWASCAGEGHIASTNAAVAIVRETERRHGIGGKE